jgi:hypothetical protein
MQNYKFEIHIYTYYVFQRTNFLLEKTKNKEGRLVGQKNMIVVVGFGKIRLQSRFDPLCRHVPRQNNKSARLCNATIFFCRKAPLFFEEF